MKAIKNVRGALIILVATTSFTSTVTLDTSATEIIGIEEPGETMTEDLSLTSGAIQVLEEALRDTESNNLQDCRVSIPVAGVVASTANLLKIDYDSLTEEEEASITDVSIEDNTVEEDDLSIEATDYTMYVSETLNVRANPNQDAEKLSVLSVNDIVHVIGKVNSGQDTEYDFVQIELENGESGFVASEYLSEEEVEVQQIQTYTWSGEKLNSYVGTVSGPSGKETYYNLNMSGVVNIMSNYGYSNYYVGSDGVKYLDGYIMVAANLDVHPRGSIIPTSLGMGVVSDTGSFALSNPYQIDIATAW